ncbi:MAG: M20/M25/M40 family metallo-hydrolase [Sulfolobales archaeon]
MDARYIAETIAREKEHWIEFLRSIVNIDSSTDYKEGVDSVGSIIAEELRSLKFDINMIKNDIYGNHILACRNRGSKPSILFVGHMDTVYPRGTVKHRPFTIKDNIAYGPGVLDMKGGIMVMLSALDALKNIDSRFYKNASICIFLNSDEEILSPSSADKIDEEAKQADLAVVFEPARPGGGYVRRRWSVARVKITVQGMSAHAGWISPRRETSAVHELVNKLSTILSNIKSKDRVLVNIGIIRGGERFNVVAPYAEAELSIRAPTKEEVEGIIREISPVVGKASTEEVNSSLKVITLWPPLLDTERNRNAFRYFQKAANELGKEIFVVDSGGGSDGNHISQYTAVVDGAGAYGENPHSPLEYIDIDRTFERAAIAARALELFYKEYISHESTHGGD